MLVLTALVLFLSAAIHAVFRFNVLFPIRKLIAASENVGRGQHTLVEVKSTDELGLLARAFNAMIEEVQQERQMRDGLLFFGAVGTEDGGMFAIRRDMEVGEA